MFTAIFLYLWAEYTFSDHRYWAWKCVLLRPLGCDLPSWRMHAITMQRNVLQVSTEFKWIKETWYRSTLSLQFVSTPSAGQLSPTQPVNA